MSRTQAASASGRVVVYLVVDLRREARELGERDLGALRARRAHRLRPLARLGPQDGAERSAENLGEQLDIAGRGNGKADPMQVGLAIAEGCEVGTLARRERRRQLENRILSGAIQ